MKSAVVHQPIIRQKSPPAREAWVEMDVVCSVPVSLLSSPPAREVWVEIYQNMENCPLNLVASREGGVG